MRRTSPARRLREMSKSRFLGVVAVTVIVLSHASLAVAATPCAGSFLRMGAGARAIGMGGAFTAVADDATAAYWNPAGLVLIEHIEATFMYAANMAVDRQLNYFAYTHWLGMGGIGISWLNAGMNDMPLWEDENTFLGTKDTGENAIMLSYGMEVGHMMVGGTAKVLHQDVMDVETQTGFGIDLGGILAVTDNVTAALMVRDIGTQYGKDDVPMNWRFGTAIRALNDALVVGFDVDKVRNVDDFVIHLGAECGMEVHPEYYTFFRAGLNSVEDQTFTTGVGIRVPYMQFDYTYVSEKEEEVLGDNHRISVTARL